MVLFTDTAPRLDDPPPPRRQRARARTIGWVLVVVGAIAAIVLALSPAPYVIEKPGPVFDTLGTSNGAGGKPLISISGQTTYPTTGELKLLTVNVSGDPTQLPSWSEIATAYFDPSEAVVPVEEIYPPSTSVEQSDEQGRLDMQNSQQEAVAAAMSDLGYTYTSSVVVASVVDGAAAKGVLEAGDVVVSLDGTLVTDVTGLRAAVAANGTGKAADIVVQRGGAERTVQVTPTAAADGSAVLGITVGGKYSFPFQVDFDLEQVGGPSAGMMFALGVIDKLTPGSLTGGADVAGTGTITADGEVGAIGGIRQKMYAARDSGATWFLAPADNCDEVVGHIPSGLRVVKVAKLTDSLNALKTIADKGDTAGLPSCSASGSAG